MIHNQKCEECVHFFLPNPKEKTQGQCRHSPPQIIVVTGESEQPQFMTSGKVLQVKKQVNQVRAMFPPIRADDPGCGQLFFKDD